MYDRSKTVGASDAVMIQTGEWAQLYDRKTQPDAAGSSEPGDRLPMDIGVALEPLNRALFTKATGLVVSYESYWTEKPFKLKDKHSHRHEEVIDNCPRVYEWCTYLPDGLVYDIYDTYGKFGGIPWMGDIPFEAKAVNMMWNPANLLTKYMPQLQHSMRVMAAPHCYFSVIYLNTRYEYTKVQYDPIYDDELFEKEQLFYFMLERGVRPPEYKGKRAGWTV